VREDAKIAKREVKPMKIAVSSTGQDLDSQIDPRFGRCAYFIIVDPDDMSFEVFDNENIALGGGAGIQSAQFVASKGAEVVITGNCGPNAVRTLNAAGIQVIVGQSGTVRQAVEDFIRGKLRASSEANVPDHYGMGGGGVGGRAMGMGRGMGMRWKSQMSGWGRGSSAPVSTSSRAGELQELRAQASELRKQIEQIELRIQELEKGHNATKMDLARRAGGQASPASVSEDSLRIAVPVSGGRLCAHFGHCESFLIVETENGQIKRTESKTPPPHEPGVLPNWMSEQGVDVVIAGGMGRRALGLFQEKGIQVVTGAPEMDPEMAVQDYLKGTLVTGQNVCDH